MTEKNQATSLPMTMAERSERRKPPLPMTAPWLVIPYGKRTKNQAFYNLCEPDNRTCRKLIPELSGKSFFQKPCHQGWLVVACNDDEVDYTPTWSYGDCFLWNPTIMGETIQLPNILSSVCTFDEYFIVDCVLSLPPRNAANHGDGNESMVVILLERCDNNCDNIFLCCFPGEKQWRTHKYTRVDHEQTGVNFIVSIHYLKGDIYGMSYCGESLFKIEKEQIDGGNIDLHVRSIEISDHIFSPCIGGEHTSSARNRYVQTCDELYRLTFRYTERGEEVISLSAAKLDFSLMEWKEVKSFGDHVLFSGKSTTACCSAAELGFNRGCLYYTLPDDQSLYKFELEGIGTVTLPCLKLPTPWSSSDWIMMLTTLRVGGQEKSEFMLDKRDEKDYAMNIGVRLSEKGKENKREVYNNGEVNKQKPGEANQQKPWSILDEDTVRMIAGYLHPIDYKELRSICKVNRSNLPILKQAITSKRTISNTYVSPWLVFPVNSECTIYTFVDPMHNNENYFMERPSLRGATIRFQKDGWLLMSEGAHGLFFHNPFTEESVKLPDLPPHYQFSNISFSSVPICPDCVVYGIQVYVDGICVYTIARGEKSWRYHDFSNIDIDEYMPLINTPVLYKGILYSVDYNGLLGALSLEDTRSFKVLDNPCATFNGAYPSYLVECGGDLLLVKLGRMGVLVGIFRLNFSMMKWVKVKSLGKHMLFVSYTSCVSRVAPHSGMENKIYFPRLSLQGEGIVFYSLDTNCYHSLGSQHSSTDFYDTKGWSSWSWIEPNWSLSSIQELDWFAPLS